MDGWRVCGLEPANLDHKPANSLNRKPANSFMRIQRYDDMIVWQKSIDLTQNVYAMTSQPPFYKDRSLVDQVRRSAVSISSNIAEGFERK